MGTLGDHYWCCPGVWLPCLRPVSASHSPVFCSLLLLHSDLGLNAVDLQLQLVVRRLNRLFLPQLSLDRRDICLQIPTPGGGEEQQERSHRCDRARKVLHCSRWKCWRQSWPVLQVLLHAFCLVQLALGLLQLFEQRHHLRLHVLHLGCSLRDQHSGVLNSNSKRKIISPLIHQSCTVHRFGILNLHPLTFRTFLTSTVFKFNL